MQGTKRSFARETYRANVYTADFQLLLETDAVFLDEHVEPGQWDVKKWSQSSKFTFFTDGLRHCAPKGRGEARQRQCSRYSVCAAGQGYSGNPSFASIFWEGSFWERAFSAGSSQWWLNGCFRWHKLELWGGELSGVQMACSYCKHLPTVRVLRTKAHNLRASLLYRNAWFCISMPWWDRNIDRKMLLAMGDPAWGGHASWGW